MRPRTWKDEHYPDGTRRRDNNIVAFIDRANGTAERRIRERDDARRGKGEWVGKTGDRRIDDPFFNPWAPGGRFNR